VNVYYSPDYVGSAYSFETTRKAAWIADSLTVDPIPGIDLVEPDPLTPTQLVRVHDELYVQAVQTGVPRHLAESQGFSWDPGLWRMVLSSNGGVVAAALDALKTGLAGSLSSGLHHARRGSGAGFCTFNGLVLAALEALDAGARSVLILDLDAHCGGGTASLIAANPRIWQVDVAVNSFDIYRAPPGVDSSKQRIRLRVAEDSGRYLSEIATSLRLVEEQVPRFDLCLYNAGMDPFEGCPTGGMRGITRELLAERERRVFDWSREHAAALAFVPAGGYVGPELFREGLVDLHRLTLGAAAESTKSSSHNCRYE